MVRGRYTVVFHALNWKVHLQSVQNCSLLTLNMEICDVLAPLPYASYISHFRIDLYGDLISYWKLIAKKKTALAPISCQFSYLTQNDFIVFLLFTISQQGIGKLSCFCFQCLVSRAPFRRNKVVVIVILLPQMHRWLSWIWECREWMG